MKGRAFSPSKQQGCYFFPFFAFFAVFAFFLAGKKHHSGGCIYFHANKILLGTATQVLTGSSDSNAP